MQCCVGKISDAVSMQEYYLDNRGQTANMSEQHPLLQPVVINVLVDHVPKRMWKSCRLVCKPWHDELLHRWRKNMHVRIGDLGKCDLKTIGDNNRFFMQAPSFLATYQPNDFRQLEKFPFRLVKTTSGEVTIGGGRRNVRVQNNFWTLCGSWLHRLHFQGVMLNDVDMLKNIIFRLTPNLQQLEFSGCDVEEKLHPLIEKNDPKALASYRPGDVQPNLKVLKISLETYTKSYVHQGMFPLSLLSLFSVFTNVEDLCLHNFMEIDLDDKFIEYLLNVFETIRKANQNSVLNIKKLDLKGLDLNFTSNTVTKLCSLSFPLEELHFRIDDVQNSIQTLLTKYSELTKLVLYNFDDEPLNPATFQLNVVPQTLTHLELKEQVFSDWAFLALFPNLKTLNIYDEWLFERMPSPKTFPRNKTLLLEFLTTFLYDSGNPAEVKTVQELTKIMPNVIKLKLSVDCAGFKVVCDAWPQLTHWEINYAELEEATFITNINKLTKLSYLQVNVTDKTNDVSEIMKGFGNDSIEEGFLLMPKLQRLSITLPHGISENLLKKLYEKVEDTRKVYIVEEGEMPEEKYPLKNIVGNGREEAIPISSMC